MTAAPGWTEGLGHGVPSLWPGQHIALFANSYTSDAQICGVSVPLFLPNVWIDVDLTKLGVPAKAIAALLCGFLILTDGTLSRDPDIALAYKHPDANIGNPADVYTGQALANGPRASLPDGSPGGSFGGIRTNFTDIVPLKNGVGQFGWLRGDPEDWATSSWPDKPLQGNQPDHASYGFNVHVALYLF